MMVMRSVLTLARSILPTPDLRSLSRPLNTPLPLAALNVSAPIMESSTTRQAEESLKVVNRVCQ